MLNEIVFLNGITELEKAFNIEVNNERKDYFKDYFSDISENFFKNIISKIIKNETIFPRNLINAFEKYGYIKEHKQEEDEYCEYCEGHGVVITKLEKYGRLYDTAIPCSRCEKGKKVDNHLKNPDPRIYPHGRKAYRKEDYLVTNNLEKTENKVKNLVYVDIVKNMD